MMQVAPCVLSLMAMSGKLAGVSDQELLLESDAEHEAGVSKRPALAGDVGDPR